MASLQATLYRLEERSPDQGPLGREGRPAPPPLLPHGTLDELTMHLEDVYARVLFGVTASDATALVAAGLFLLLAALIACVPPALRAMRVDPVEGLRAE